MNIYEKLTSIQVNLKAPKCQENKFGGYKYRSCEDILEALKPKLQENKVTMFITDSIEQVGNRVYIKATITLVNIEKPEETIVTTAFAREEESKKGMDNSQLTGASSSYARKYALNAMFAIDDTKDPDNDKAQTYYCEKCNIQISRDMAVTSWKKAKRKLCSQCLGGNK